MLKVVGAVNSMPMTIGAFHGMTPARLNGLKIRSYVTG
jgi:hypothetical protein